MDINHIRKAWDNLWDIKRKKIERLEEDARHPYAKKFDEIFGNPLVGGRRVVPKHNKNSRHN